MANLTFPQNPANRAAYVEPVRASLDSIISVPRNFALHQTTEPTQDDWETAWVTAGYSLPIPKNVELMWNDTQTLRGMYAVIDDRFAIPIQWGKALEVGTQIDSTIPTPASSLIWPRWWYDDNSLLGIGTQAGNSGTFQIFPDGSVKHLSDEYLIAFHPGTKFGIIQKAGILYYYDLVGDSIGDVIQSNLPSYDNSQGDPAPVPATYLGSAFWNGDVVQLTTSSLGDWGEVFWKTSFDSTDRTIIEAHVYSESSSPGQLMEYGLFLGCLFAPSVITDFQGGYGVRIGTTDIKLYYDTTVLASVSNTIGVGLYAEVASYSIRLIVDNQNLKVSYRPTALQDVSDGWVEVISYDDTARSFPGPFREHGIAAFSTAGDSVEAYCNNFQMSDTGYVQPSIPTTPVYSGMTINPDGSPLLANLPHYGWSTQGELFQWDDPNHVSDKSVYYASDLNQISHYDDVGSSVDDVLQAPYHAHQIGDFCVANGKVFWSLLVGAKTYMAFVTLLSDDSIVTFLGDFTAQTEQMLEYASWHFRVNVDDATIVDVLPAKLSSSTQSDDPPDADGQSLEFSVHDAHSWHEHASYDTDTDVYSSILVKDVRLAYLDTLREAVAKNLTAGSGTNFVQMDSTDDWWATSLLKDQVVLLNVLSNPSNDRLFLSWGEALAGKIGMQDVYVQDKEWNPTGSIGSATTYKKDEFGRYGGIILPINDNKSTGKIWRMTEWSSPLNDDHHLISITVANDTSQVDIDLTPYMDELNDEYGIIKLQMKFIPVSPAPVTGGYFSVRFNDDAGSNYSNNAVYTLDGSWLDFPLDETSMKFFASSGAFGDMVMYIYHANSQAKYAELIGRGLGGNPDVNGNQIFGVWRNTDPITKISILHAPGETYGDMPAGTTIHVSALRTKGRYNRGSNYDHFMA